MIQYTYTEERCCIKRLNGATLSLELCFINLAVIQHIADKKSRLAADTSSGNNGTETSPFSIPARIKVEIPPQSRQVSLSTLFQPYRHNDGTETRPKRVLIWGRAGMGKTTLCKKIVHDFYHNTLWRDLYTRIVWIPLRNLWRLAESCQSIGDLLKHEFPCRWSVERTHETFHDIADDERTLFLLDGLDEVSSKLADDKILRDLLRRPNIIITSRPHQTRLPLRPDIEMETIGFLPEQVNEYLSRIAGDQAGQIRDFINERPIVRSLAGIPIQLDAICYTWTMKRFPRDNVTMTALYIAISRNLWASSALRLEKKRNGRSLTMPELELSTNWEIETIVQNEASFLQELAFRGLCEEVTEFSVKDIEAIRKSMHSSDCIHLLFLRVSDSSIPVEDRTFHFIHLTFQEFFAAQYFVLCWSQNKRLLGHQRRQAGGISSAPIITPQNFVKTEKYTDRYNIFWRFVVGLLNDVPDKAQVKRFFLSA